MPHDSRSQHLPEIRTLGDDILGIKVPDAGLCQQTAEQLRHSGSWLEAVAGIHSVAVQFDAAAMDRDAAREQLAKQLLSIEPVIDDEAARIEVPVCYGGEFGPDFDAVCASLDLSAEQLIALHTSREYTIDMLGFTPGFAYIGGLPAELDVPRLAEPRQHVVAGSVGIADGRTGIYAMAGPGGWPLIGRTSATLFDGDAEQPFVLSAGMRIRFVPVGAKEFSAAEQQ